MIVRLLSHEHIVCAAELEQACFSDASDTDGFSAFALSSSNIYMETVDDAGRLLAYGGISVAADEAEVINIAVDPAFRRQGIARCLMLALMQAAYARGARTMYLEVRASNFQAAALYGAIGFSEIGRRKNYYSSPKEDAILMACPLSEGERTDSVC